MAKHVFVAIVLILTIVFFGFNETPARPVEKGSHDGVLIKHSRISADLKDIPLMELLIRIQEQCNVWFKCNESLLDEKVSVRFKDLSLEDGMKRILSSMNHVFVFDANGRLAGVMILGKSKTGMDMAKNRHLSPRKPPSAMALGRDTAKDYSESTSYSSERSKPRPVIQKAQLVKHPNIKPAVSRVHHDNASVENPDSARPVSALGVSRHMMKPMQDQ
ncbi:MAG: hypothetical protein JRI94_13985 [Deltaproteobacteria bacterium]|nr:hypothetical protein [Deltaproteobacteria bacterium]MBW2115074.1 hypothetical protein [Deltaproteobacteria bacterium]